MKLGILARPYIQEKTLAKVATPGSPMEYLMRKICFAKKMRHAESF